MAAFFPPPLARTGRSGRLFQPGRAWPMRADNRKAAAQGNRLVTGPLTDVRIVEVSAFIAGPLGGMTLAQLGADVIRIDPIGGNIDIARWPLAPDGSSLYWASLN